MQLFQGPQLRIVQTMEDNKSVYHYSETVTLHCEVTAYPLPETITWSLCWRGQDTCDNIEVEVSVVDPSSYVIMVRHDLVLASSNSSSISVTCSADNKWNNTTFSEQLSSQGTEKVIHSGKSESKTFHIVGK